MCINCDPSQPLSTYIFPYNSPCTNCDNGECPGGIAPTDCIYYPGPALTCIGSLTNDRLSSILQKIDAKLCSISPDSYSTYNTYCLAPTNTEKEFVEKISQQFCTLRADFNTFTTSTYPAAIASLQASITALDTPNLTSCSQIGFAPNDTIKGSLSKLATAVCNIYNGELSVAGVNWAQCSVVPTPPTTIVGGFNFVVAQLCNLSTQIGNSGVLPTFDNTGTCLSSPTATDSLSATVIKIRSRLCGTPLFDANSLSWNCITNPATGPTDLQSSFQAILSKIDALSQNAPAFDPSSFTVTPTNPLQPCAGQTVSLINPVISADRYVAVNNLDTSPGTLSQKITPGTGITLDTTTTPGTMIINASATGGDEKVKTSTLDPTAGYLEDKIVGFSTSLVTTIATTVANQVRISASINLETLITNIFDELENNATLRERFCAIVSMCPSPCQAPSNITVTYVP